MLKSIKNNPVTTTVFILAFITVLFVPVDKEYINYFDIKTLLPQFLLVLFLLILLPIIFVKKEPLKINYDDKISFNKTKIVIYLFMFLLSLLVAPLTIGIVIIVILAFILDKKALVMMDWDLLLTFCLFFIFSGNISRITSISDFLKSLLDKNVLITGIVSCQFISNVPTAVLLSKFTNNYTDLLISVNI